MHRLRNLRINLPGQRHPRQKMLKEISLQIIEAIKTNGPKSVFIAGIIEQVISPIPSVFIPMSAGFFLVPQKIPLFVATKDVIRKISLPYAFGATIGSSVLYLTALFGGRLLIEKFGKFFGVSVKNIDLFREKFTRGFKDELIILLLLFLPVTPISLVAASCGIIGIPPQEFYPLLLIGSFVRSIFLGILGWRIGESYNVIASGIDRIESLVTLFSVSLVSTIMVFLYWKRQKILKD